MRVRYQVYEDGLPIIPYRAECDLSPSRAKSLFLRLKANGKCGWAELVAEEDDEGEYMEVIEYFDKCSVARAVSSLF